MWPLILNAFPTPDVEGGHLTLEIFNLKEFVLMSLFCALFLVVQQLKFRSIFIQTYFAPMHHTLSKSVRNSNTSVQNKIFIGMTILTLPLQHFHYHIWNVEKLVQKYKLASILVLSLLLKLVIVMQHSLVQLLQKYNLHA